MLGSTFERKKANGGGTFRVTGQTHDTPAWVLQREDAFESPLAILPADLRKQFVKAGDAPEPETVTDEQAGWDRLSAEAKFAAYAQAAAQGELQEGDRIGHPGVSGAQVEARVPLDDAAVGTLKAHARKLRGKRQPSPEEVFAEASKDSIQAAADRIWASDGITGLLPQYELGHLEVSPPIAKELDKRIRERNRAADKA